MVAQNFVNQIDIVMEHSSDNSDGRDDFVEVCVDPNLSPSCFLSFEESEPAW